MHAIASLSQEQQIWRAGPSTQIKTTGPNKKLLTFDRPQTTIKYQGSDQNATHIHLREVICDIFRTAFNHK